MKRWQFWLGVLISAVFLYFFALPGLKLGEAWQAIKSARFLWLIPGVAVYFVGVWLRTWRWHYLLRPLKKIPTQSMFSIVTIGYMGTYTHADDRALAPCPDAGRDHAPVVPEHQTVPRAPPAPKSGEKSSRPALRRHECCRSPG